MRNNFDKLLLQLNDELTDMGNLIETAINNAVNTLTNNGEYTESSARVIEKMVNQKEKDMVKH